MLQKFKQQLASNGILLLAYFHNGLINDAIAEITHTSITNQELMKLVNNQHKLTNRISQHVLLERYINANRIFVGQIDVENKTVRLFDSTHPPLNRTNIIFTISDENLFRKAHNKKVLMRKSLFIIYIKYCEDITNILKQSQ